METLSPHLGTHPAWPLALALSRSLSSIHPLVVTHNCPGGRAKASRPQSRGPTTQRSPDSALHQAARNPLWLEDPKPSTQANRLQVLGLVSNGLSIHRSHRTNATLSCPVPNTVLRRALELSCSLTDLH